MRIIIWTLFSILNLGLTPLYVNSQESEKIFFKVIKRGGWKVPGKDEFKTVVKEQEFQVEGITIRVKSFSVKPELFAELDAYSIGVDSELRTGSQSCVVREFDSYEVGKKTFAYVIHFNYASMRKDGTFDYTFANSKMAYIDEDGNGNYETRYDISSAPRRLKLPDWVKSFGKKASSNNSFNRSANGAAFIHQLVRLDTLNPRPVNSSVRRLNCRIEKVGQTV